MTTTGTKTPAEGDVIEHGGKRYRVGAEYEDGEQRARGVPYLAPWGGIVPMSDNDKWDGKTNSFRLTPIAAGEGETDALPEIPPEIMLQVANADAFFRKIAREEIAAHVERQKAENPGRIIGPLDMIGPIAKPAFNPAALEKSMAEMGYEKVYEQPQPAPAEDDTEALDLIVSQHLGLCATSPIGMRGMDLLQRDSVRKQMTDCAIAYHAAMQKGEGVRVGDVNDWMATRILQSVCGIMGWPSEEISASETVKLAEDAKSRLADLQSELDAVDRALDDPGDRVEQIEADKEAIASLKTKLAEAENALKTAHAANLLLNEELGPINSHCCICGQKIEDADECADVHRRCAFTAEVRLTVGGWRAELEAIIKAAFIEMCDPLGRPAHPANEEALAILRRWLEPFVDRVGKLATESQLSALRAGEGLTESDMETLHAAARAAAVRLEATGGIHAISPEVAADFGHDAFCAIRDLLPGMVRRLASRPVASPDKPLDEAEIEGWIDRLCAMEPGERRAILGENLRRGTFRPPPDARMAEDARTCAEWAKDHLCPSQPYPQAMPDAVRESIKRLLSRPASGGEKAQAATRANAEPFVDTLAKQITRKLFDANLTRFTDCGLIEKIIEESLPSPHPPALPAQATEEMAKAAWKAYDDALCAEEELTPDALESWDQQIKGPWVASVNAALAKAPKPAAAPVTVEDLLAYIAKFDKPSNHSYAHIRLYADGSGGIYDGDIDEAAKEIEEGNWDTYEGKIKRDLETAVRESRKGGTGK